MAYYESEDEETYHDLTGGHITMVHPTRHCFNTNPLFSRAVPEVYGWSLSYASVCTPPTTGRSSQFERVGSGRCTSTDTPGSNRISLPIVPTTPGVVRKESRDSFYSEERPRDMGVRDVRTSTGGVIRSVPPPCQVRFGPEEGFHRWRDKNLYIPNDINHPLMPRYYAACRLAKDLSFDMRQLPEFFDPKQPEEPYEETKYVHEMIMHTCDRTLQSLYISYNAVELSHTVAHVLNLVFEKLKKLNLERKERQKEKKEKQAAHAVSDKDQSSTPKTPGGTKDGRVRRKGVPTMKPYAENPGRILATTVVAIRLFGYPVLCTDVHHALMKNESYAKVPSSVIQRMYNELLNKHLNLPIPVFHISTYCALYSFRIGAEDVFMKRTCAIFPELSCFQRVQMYNRMVLHAACVVEHMCLHIMGTSPEGMASSVILFCHSVLGMECPVRLLADICDINADTIINRFEEIRPFWNFVLCPELLEDPGRLCTSS